MDLDDRNMAISVDATSQGNDTAGTTITISHTVNSGDNRILIVLVVSDGSGASTATYDGNAMTQLSGSFGVANPGLRTRGFYLIDPPVGTANIVVTKGTDEPGAVAGISIFGADVTDYENGQVADAQTSSSLSMIASKAGILIDIIGLFANSPTVDGSQTQFATQDNFSGTKDMAASYKLVTAGSPTMDWTFSSDDYAHSAVFFPEIGNAFVPRAMFF